MSLSKLLLLLSITFSCFNLLAVETISKTDNVLDSGSIKQASITDKIELLQLIPLAVMLDSDLENLIKQSTFNVDPLVLNKQYKEFEEKLTSLKKKINKASLIGDNNYAENFNLKKEILAILAEIKKAMAPLDSTIEKLDRKNKEWLEIQKTWQRYESEFNSDKSLRILAKTFEHKDEIISRAFDFIKNNLNDALLLQVRGSELLATTDQFIREINSDIAKTRDKYINNHSSPLYSVDFYKQFNLVLWHTIIDRLEMFSLPSPVFYEEHGYFSSLTILLFLVFLVLILQNRSALAASEYLNFIAKRPISFLVFLATLIIGLFLNINGASEVNQLVNKVIGSIAIVRILTLFVDNQWRINACYWAMFSYVFILILFTAGMPYPILRLTYIVLSLVALVACVRFLISEEPSSKTDVHRWFVKLELFIFIFILLAEFWGKVSISSFIFISLLKLLSIFIPLALFARIVEKAIHWVFFASIVWEIKLMRNEAQILVDKVSFMANLIIFYYLFIPVALSVLSVYNSFTEAYDELNNIGFFIGSQWIAINTLVTSFVVLYLTLLISKIFPMICLDEAIIGKKIERGVRVSISRLIQYFIVFIGLIVALSSFGIDMAQLTIIFGALSVGIGFGLQGISNDFISGLILLFERPLREGDIIEVNNAQARIKRIGLRATVAVTYDEAEVIIPNGALIASQVTNWTLSNKEVRVILNVAVVYESNVPLVMSTLNNCSQIDSQVLKSPAPNVVLVAFGDNALMFELRVWIEDADAKIQVRSNIYLEIERQFREKGIEFAFPQLVVHQHGNKAHNDKIESSTAEI